MYRLSFLSLLPQNGGERILSDEAFCVITI